MTATLAFLAAAMACLVVGLALLRGVPVQADLDGRGRGVRDGYVGLADETVWNTAKVTATSRQKPSANRDCPFAGTRVRYRT
jgi:hypothetical protein